MKNYYIIEHGWCEGSYGEKAGDLSAEGSGGGEMGWTGRFWGKKGFGRQGEPKLRGISF
jgi:hypothetical protein